LSFRHAHNLFDFALAENHMFARTRVIFFQFKLFRLGAWVLFGHVKIASVGCAYEFNLQGRWLRHDTYSLMPCDTSLPNFRLSLKNCAQRAVKLTKCQVCISVFLVCLIVALPPFCVTRMMMTAGAVPSGFVTHFCQFCHRQPNQAKCCRK
jgi:hypothetical protein